MKAALTVSEYIAGFPPHVRVRLNAMRAMIRKAIPRVTETISYGIAAFKVPEGPVVYIAGFKNHVSFFPTSSGIRAFKGEFRGYKVSTGTVQFRLDQELPISLLKRIVLFRLNELGAKGGTQRGSTLKLKFKSRLERISDDAEYFAASVPQAISKKIGIKTSVPVLASVNGSKPFRGSLFPVGGGEHWMRIKESVRSETGIREGDLVAIVITVLDPGTKNAPPAELVSALKKAGLLKAFELISPGKRNFLIRRVSEAKRDETRARRIQEILDHARKRGER